MASLQIYEILDELVIPANVSTIANHATALHITLPKGGSRMHMKAN